MYYTFSRIWFALSLQLYCIIKDSYWTTVKAGKYACQRIDILQYINTDKCESLSSVFIPQ